MRDKKPEGQTSESRYNLYLSDFSGLLNVECLELRNKFKEKWNSYQNFKPPFMLTHRTGPWSSSHGDRSLNPVKSNSHLLTIKTSEIYLMSSRVYSDVCLNTSVISNQYLSSNLYSNVITYTRINSLSVYICVCFIRNYPILNNIQKYPPTYPTDSKH